MARYDTQAAFASSGSWSTFDVAAINGGAKGFRGAAFDGRFLYLSPQTNDTGQDGIVARFDAKSVSWLPKGWNASFL